MWALVWARGAGSMRGSCYRSDSWFVASVRSGFREPLERLFWWWRTTRADSLRPASLPFASSYRGSVRRKWKAEGKYGAAILLVAAGDLALMILHHAVTGAEA